MGVVALFAHFVVCAIMLHSRGQLTSALALWRFTRPDAVGNIAVIAAALMVAALGSNVPDLVIGAAMAGLFVVAGWRIALTGRADAGRALSQLVTSLLTSIDAGITPGAWENHAKNHR